MANPRKRSTAARSAKPPDPVPVIPAEPPASPPSDAVPPRRPTRARLQTFFLRQFARSGSLADAAARTGIAPRTVQRWKEVNVAFARRYEAVREARHELLEDAAMRRALGKVSRAVFHRGEHVANVERHNDVMLIRLLTRFDRLRERRGTVATARRDKDALIDEEIRLLDEACERGRWEDRP